MVTQFNRILEKPLVLTLFDGIAYLYPMVYFNWSVYIRIIVGGSLGVKAYSIGGDSHTVPVTCSNGGRDTPSSLSERMFIVHYSL